MHGVDVNPDIYLHFVTFMLWNLVMLIELLKSSYAMIDVVFVYVVWE